MTGRVSCRGGGSGRQIELGPPGQEGSCQDSRRNTAGRPKRRGLFSSAQEVLGRPIIRWKTVEW